jgi:hypothetical protein
MDATLNGVPPPATVALATKTRSAKMTTATLIVGSRIWVEVNVRTITARGRITPRLLLLLELRTLTERVAAELHDVRVQVACRNELVGEGRLIGEPAAWHGHQCELEIPVTRRALEFVTERLERHAAIDLTLDWYGLLRVRWEPNPSDKRTASDPEPGTWTDLHLRQHEHHVAVARSDWYSQVVQAVSGDDYLHLEVAVPRGPEQARWRKALDRLADAEKAFALGDDAGVFQHLKGVFEAVPGAKQHIFDALPDPKRGEVDRLTKAFVGYLNHGRHVMDEGTYEGQFPVDRQDAGLAIAVTQVILSYASRALAAARPPS